MSRWTDISMPLYSGMPVWPGDTEYRFQLSWTKEVSGSVNVGQLLLSTHTGTHVDAPFHFDERGNTMENWELELGIGPARLIHLPGRTSIGVEDVKPFDLDGVERLLIRTDGWANRSCFPASIPHLEPDIAPFLAERGVRLLGLDLPSVDPIDSKELPAHHALARCGIHILEGLVLERVEVGEYELIALPLAIQGGDASPVRAVIRPLGCGKREGA
jgi:arylformamidase